MFSLPRWQFCASGCVDWMQARYSIAFFFVHEGLGDRWGL